MSGPVPTAGAAIPARTAPPFHEIIQHARMNREMQLVDVPPNLGQRVGLGPGPRQQEGAAPDVAGNGGRPDSRNPPGGGGPDRGNREGGNQQRTQVEARGQNPALKAAWAATGHSSIFGPGSPYRDESQRNNKRIVMRPGRDQRICLAMALRGICYSNCSGYHAALSLEEVRAVAHAGGLQVAGL